MNTKLLCLALALFASSSVKSFSQPAEPKLELTSVKKIWDAGAHNAFTDLIRFNGKWFCTFRESEAHVGGDGKIRVLASTNGDQWDSAALLSEAGVDLRDPKLSITPDNRLMLVLGGSVYTNKTVTERQPRVAFSKDGRTWTEPQRVLSKDDWLWRVTWFSGRAYGIVYTVPVRAANNPGNDWVVRLVESDDGVDYHFVKKLDVPGRPNEATLRFLENGDCVALVRREGAGVGEDRAAWIGTSRAPFQEWKWQPAGLFIGGPNFIVLPSGAMIASGRQMKPAPEGAKTFVGRMDQKSVTPQLVLPSGGDCSYPGLVWHDGVLWVSFYSSHEGKASIYLAKVKVPGN